MGACDAAAKIADSNAAIWIMASFMGVIAVAIICGTIIRLKGR